MGLSLLDILLVTRALRHTVWLPSSAALGLILCFLPLVLCFRMYHQPFAGENDDGPALAEDGLWLLEQEGKCRGVVAPIIFKICQYL